MGSNVLVSERFEQGSSADLELLRRLRARDSECLTQLFQETNPALIRMLRAQNVRGEQAQDLIHQAWETFFAGVDQFEGRSSIKTFVTGILLNKIREHRRAVARVSLEDNSEDVYAHSFTPEGWWRRDPEDPDQLLRSKEFSRFLAECMESLTDSQRSAFHLIEVEEEPASSVCNVLSVTATNLRVLLFRAKQKLRLCLEGRTELG